MLRFSRTISLFGEREVSFFLLILAGKVFLCFRFHYWMFTSHPENRAYLIPLFRAWITGAADLPLLSMSTDRQQALCRAQLGGHCSADLCSPATVFLPSQSHLLNCWQYVVGILQRSSSSTYHNRSPLSPPAPPPTAREGDRGLPVFQLWLKPEIPEFQWLMFKS